MLLSRNLSKEMSQKLFNDYCSLPQVATWVADNAVFCCVLVLLAVLSLYVWTMCANGYVFVCVMCVIKHMFVLASVCTARLLVCVHQVE